MEPIKDVQVVRQVNRGAVLELLRREGPMPRTAIARATKLTAPTSFAIVDELVAAGLVRCVATSRSSPGRPRAIFQFNPAAAYSLGVDLSGASFVGVLIDLSARVLETRRVARPNPPDVSAVIQWIASFAQEMRSSPALDPSKLAGLGVAIPALLEADSGHVITSTNLNWHDVPFARLLEEAVGTGVYLENTPRSIALCERWFGAASEAEHLLCINIGMGIGMGLIIDGKLYVGDDAQSGELGHTAVVPNGAPCRCGGRGCLEAEAAGGAILRNAVDALQRGMASSLAETANGDPRRITLDMVVNAADEGDPLASSVVRAAGQMIGTAVRNAVILLNPTMVVLSGSLVHSSQLLFETVRAVVQNRALPPLHRVSAMPIVRAQLGLLAGAVGAAGLVHQRRMGLYDGTKVVAP
ncbi:MAG: ROK family transcriptional regulator [Chloroflexi bacterium]|nr:ROK family transcriptional regulator [Chloroflexota bacterium]